MVARIRVIVPKDFNTKAFRDKVMDGIEETIKEADREFAKTYATWEREPEFEQEYKESKKQLSGKTTTDNEVYGYVNDGTKDSAPYPIPKAGPGLLRFQWGGKGSYKPKTQVRRIGSGPGGPSGPMVVFRRVMHPGIEGRHFDEEIAKAMAPRFQRRMVSAMSEAARASGHAIRR